MGGGCGVGGGRRGVLLPGGGAAGGKQMMGVRGCPSVGWIGILDPRCNTDGHYTIYLYVSIGVISILYICVQFSIHPPVGDNVPSSVEPILMFTILSICLYLSGLFPYFLFLFSFVFIHQ